jgi:hypothetical protein
MQFVPLYEAIACQNASEANNYPEVLRQLRDRIGGQLMKLNLKL